MKNPIFIWFAIVALNPALACAQDSLPAPAADSQTWNLHFQSTVGGQGHPSFRAAYSGPNSMKPGGEVEDTVSVDVTGGVRLWHGGEFFADFLVWQGYGLSNSLGAAGFPNGEAFRIGTTYPDAYISRAFIRETIGFSGEKEAADDAPFELRGAVDARRLTFTVGHFSAKDIFDSNAYANDSRTQFMNWSVMANTAWDYPANTLGFTNGAAVEWTAHTCTARFFAYITHAHMGNYQETINNPNLSANIMLTRAYRSKYGFGLNLEQEIHKDLGAFMRLGWSDGKNETWEFTDVDRTASAGLSLKGARWRRPEDTVGLGAVVNGISAAHRQFLAAGGLGITVGDGALDYRSERLAEAYYNWKVAKRLGLTLDYQYEKDPAYNHARGPIHIFATRLHTEF